MATKKAPIKKVALKKAVPAKVVQTKRFKKWELYFKQKGLDPNVMPDVSMVPPQFQKSLLAAYKLQVINEVENKGEQILDYTDWSQSKYEPRFRVVADKKRPSGFGLSCVVCGSWSSLTGVGPRLAFAKYDAAKHVATTFVKLYEDLMLISK